MASQALTALLYSEFSMNTPTPTINQILGQPDYTPSTTPDATTIEYLHRTIFLGFDASTPASPFRDLTVLDGDLKVGIASMFRQSCHELGDVVAGDRMGKCVRRWIASEEHLGHGKAIIAFTYPEGKPTAVHSDELDGITAILTDYFDDLYADPMMVEGNTSII